MDGDPLRSAIEQAPYILIACEGADLRIIGLNGASRVLYPGRDLLGLPLREAMADLAGQQWIDLYEQVYRRRVRAARAATACVAVLDPASGALAYCTAGHPPPLVVSAAGAARFLPASGAAPLGTGGDFPVATAGLDPGDVLLLYSDGIIERPGRGAAEAAEELARVAADAVAGRALHAPEASAAERACTQTVELLVRATGHSDDITLLAAQLVAAPEPLHTEVRADLTRLGLLRKTFGGWLEAVGVTDEDAFALQHAVGELVTNAVEHATGGEPVEVRARLTDAGAAEVVVAGRGPWREPERVSERGRGLALSTQLVDELTLERSGDGTVATLRLRVTRPAALLTGAAPCLPPRPAAELSIVDTAGGAAVLVAGPVDAGSADRLRHELLYRSRGGTVALTVDLAGVTHLASAGVAALHAVAARHRVHGTALTLLAPPGSTAQHVLALVAVPYA
ncbi:SpoIIE family protein phosphatase [Dactylosporangium sp. NPDC048998]|uniref:SpoIIE family protein phosphatase n=1 Tax=Dactylosporangium sp. NPDC048998 TaxID=3363976 RepID=UPI003713D543